MKIFMCRLESDFTESQITTKIITRKTAVSLGNQCNWHREVELMA